MPPQVVAQVTSRLGALSTLDTTSAADLTEMVNDCTAAGFTPMKHEPTPEWKWELHQREAQSAATRRDANAAIRNYKRWAKGKSFTDRATVLAYRDWLMQESGKSAGTARKELAHVRSWLLQAYDKKVNMKWRGEAEQVRPHVAYKETDIMELIGKLRQQVST